jgi:hypothetical protein
MELKKFITTKRMKVLFKKRDLLQVMKCLVKNIMNLKQREIYLNTLKNTTIIRVIYTVLLTLK